MSTDYNNGVDGTLGIASNPGALHWRQLAKCASLTPEQFDKLFFPDSGRSIKKAREYCQGCPVKDDCLEFALENDCVGIWAGTNYEERKGIISFKGIMTASESLSTAPLAPSVIRVEGKQLKTPLVSKISKPMPTHKKVVGKRKKRKAKIRRSNFRAAD